MSDMESLAAQIEAKAGELADLVEAANASPEMPDTFKNVTAAFADEVRSKFGQWVPKRMRKEIQNRQEAA